MREEVPEMSVPDDDDPSKTRMLNNWRRTLDHMIADHRRRYPEATRHQTDQELRQSLINYFISKGVVKRTADVHYLIPDLEGPSPAGWLQPSRSRSRSG
jgi:hypothetical protein